MGERQTRLRALYCEALRECGVLVLVFASLDGAFQVVTVSWWAVLLWAGCGVVLLVLGIHLDPEGLL